MPCRSQLYAVAKCCWVDFSSEWIRCIGWDNQHSENVVVASWISVLPWSWSHCNAKIKTALRPFNFITIRVCDDLGFESMNFQAIVAAPFEESIVCSLIATSSGSMIYRSFFESGNVTIFRIHFHAGTMCFDEILPSSTFIMCFLITNGDSSSGPGPFLFDWLIGMSKKLVVAIYFSTNSRRKLSK